MPQHLIDGGQLTAGKREGPGYTHADGGGNGSHREGSEATDDNPDGNGHGNGHQRYEESTSGDSTLVALEALKGALDEMSHDRELLQRRLEELHRKRSEGKAWRDILSEEEPPGTMQVVSRMLACLAKASGTLRKELVDSLRREGVSIPAIAKLFGVTHQRVSNLLRRPAE